MFMTVVLMTGPIWAKPIWGAWWAWWDVRLTLTLFLWFVYRRLSGAARRDRGRGMRARYSAVLGVLGALLIPFIHLSVYLFRRAASRCRSCSSRASRRCRREMLTTFSIAFVAFSCSVPRVDARALPPRRTARLARSCEEER